MTLTQRKQTEIEKAYLISLEIESRLYKLRQRKSKLDKQIELEEYVLNVINQKWKQRRAHKQRSKHPIGC